MKIPSLSVLIVVSIISGPVLTEAEERSLPAECSYEMQVWNVNLRSSAQAKKVRHPYDDLTPVETDRDTGCTVCSEDQVLVDISPLQPFFVCHRLAPRVRAVVRDLLRSGSSLHSVVGYRVIRSRGPVDEQGNRTEFSNHSYGTALDINPEQNGLYDDCVTFGPQCRLIRGGEWKLGVTGALDKNNPIVTMFKQAGFKWGGEIAGKQKDFMHFSLTGY
jgi:hypothetical protein